ncbi:MAG TPA: hypothetical protein PKH29_08965, partial [Oscillospiraceae bacterium]|nr:hypothetical protein [Oscillospiraceae bacterium]
MKKLIAAVVLVALLWGFIPACDSSQTVRFQLKITYPVTEDYFICAEGQEIKYKLEFEDYPYTEELSGNTTFRIYDVVIKYPSEVTVREDGRSFWTLYVGYVLPSKEYFPY